jgi:hypothetical protein
MVVAASNPTSNRGVLTDKWILAQKPRSPEALNTQDKPHETQEEGKS